MRCKTRTLEKPVEEVEQLPRWEACYLLKPVFMCCDPVLGGQNVLALCETMYDMDQPGGENTRADSAAVLEAVSSKKPVFSMRQCYQLVDRNGHPLGWPKHGYPLLKDTSYCAVGADRVFGREIVETHYRACLHAGLAIASSKALPTPGQWEFHIGSCEGIAMGDELWMARFLLYRVAEQFGVCVSLDPKPLAMTGKEWNGAGCHTTFSTEEIRQPDGPVLLEMAMDKLKLSHSSCMAEFGYGKDAVPPFTWGKGSQSMVNIREDATKGKGYLEDRRPSSNCDPYQVTRAIAESILMQ